MMPTPCDFASKQNAARPYQTVRWFEPGTVKVLKGMCYFVAILLGKFFWSSSKEKRVEARV